MKEAGIAKRKWNLSTTMEQKSSSANKPRSARSIIQVDEDVHLLLDNNDLDFSDVQCADKSMEQSRRTYSKKTPVVYRSPFLPQDTIRSFNSSLPSRSKVQSSTSLKFSSPALTENKTLQRKRKGDFDPLNTQSLVSRKIQRSSLPLKFQSTPKSCVANVPKQSRNATECTPVHFDSSSDSEIEVVAVFKPNSSMGSVPVNHIAARKFPNAQSSLSSKKVAKSFESEGNGKELLINEADIAPIMPSNPTVFPDVNNRMNSMRWLSANGTIAVSGHESRSFNGTGESQSKGYNKEPLFLPELKQGKEEQKRGNRELKCLYDNLNEISWAHETSFKNLLRRPEYIRHSERSNGRVEGTGKNLRKKEPPTLDKAKGAINKKKSAINLLAQKKSRMARSLKAKPSIKNKIVPKVKAIKKEKPEKQPESASKKKTSINTKPVPVESASEDETEIRYKINPNILKEKFDFPKTKPAVVTKTKAPLAKIKTDEPKIKLEVTKPKSDAPKIKLNGVKTEPFKMKTAIKLKPDAQKVRADLLKLKPDAQKLKSNVFQLKPSGPKGKPELSKLKSCIQIKPEDSPPSTSGLQNGSCKNKGASNSKSFAKPTGMKNFLKEINNYGFSNEMQLLQGFFSDNDDLYSAFKKGSKLRVCLEPLEHTKLWNAEFYEEFRKHCLDQALRKALEKRDHDSITVMYQELLDSFMSSQNNRVIKKKKPEEEALRSSVRQSEGAFRYKEIVVKKHPNYMQVILVPNDMKQNSLTVEAMKELKDAFLLAKKDPNCNAVLLNSSGSYFCTGIDLSPLVGSNKKQAAEEISNSICDLVMTLGLFTKPVIAAVNGAAIGFGVSILTYCDVVLASDKATFCLPATKIGYIPEGGITLTLPQVVGSSVASELFMYGRRFTAEQACRYGLVNEVLWPSKFMNEVIPRLKTIISQPLQPMEATKTMVRCHLWDKLKSHVDRERRLLCEHWLGAQCQANIKQLLQTGWLAD